MRTFFTIIRACLVSIVVFTTGAICDIGLTKLLILCGVAAFYIVLLDVLLRVRRYDGVLHIDNSRETTVMQLEFCADPRHMTGLNEVYFKIDAEARLTPGRRTNNELVEKALDEIEEFH